MCTYTYFALLLMSEQFIDTTASATAENTLIYFPVGLAFEFVFYMGWLKVGLRSHAFFKTTPTDYNTPSHPNGTLMTRRR